MAKLTDSQLIVLSKAAAREDGAAVVPPKLNKAAAAKIGSSLIGRKLMREIRSKPGMPIWRADENGDTGGEFGDGRKSRALRHFDSRMRMSLRESRRFLIDNLSFHLILQSMDGHVTSIAPNRPDS